jgi:hypothetical protein
MDTSTSTAVTFAQGQDDAWIRVVVDRTTREVKDYVVIYKDQRQVVEALDAAQFDSTNKSSLEVLDIRERRLEAARVRDVIGMSNLTICLIADNSASDAQATAIMAANVVPAVSAATSATTYSVAEKKIIKRKLPEPRDGWRNSAG